MYAAYLSLVSQNVDAVIGGATPTSASMLSIVATQFDEVRIPTVLLSNAVTPVYDPSQYEHVLQIGLPEKTVYGANLEQWLDVFDLDKVSTLYDESHSLTFEYGAKVTPEVLSEYRNSPDLQQLSFFAGVVTGYDDEVDAVKDHGSEGVVLSVLPWNMTEIVLEISQATPAHIFIAPPVTSIEQITEIAVLGVPDVSYGVEFWPRPGDTQAMQFMAQVRQQLGWMGDSSVSTVAIKVHYAVQLIIGCTRCGRRRGN